MAERPLDFRSESCLLMALMAASLGLGEGHFVASHALMKLQDALECDCCDCYCQKLQCHDYNVPNFSQAAWPQQLKSFLQISRVGIVCVIMMTGWLVAMSCNVTK